MSRPVAPGAKAHSRLSPSASARWLTCGGSIALCESLPPAPERPDSAATEGTFAHFLLETCLRKRTVPQKFIGKTLQSEDGPFQVTNEMAEAVEVATDWVRSEEERLGVKAQPEVWNQVHCLGDGQGGTCDITLVGSAELVISDYKHGRGVVVEAENNTQCQLYALGAYRKLPKATQKAIKKITCVIIQPRCPHPEGPVRSWSMTVTQLLDFEEFVEDQVSKIKAGSAPRVPSEYACRWCDAKAVCPDIAKKAVGEARQDFDAFMTQGPMLVNPATAKPLTDEQLAAAMEHIDLLKIWVKAVEEEVFGRLQAGKIVPGFKLVEGKANRQWTSEVEVIKALDSLGIDQDKYAPRSLSGLGAIEALLPKAERAQFMSKYTRRPNGKPTLANASDPRPALSSTPAADDFSDHIDPMLK